ncbi:hypothetical protein KAE78_10950 [Microbacterium sp. NIBRBAC000506063]|nr:hypothetical protein KAE78_10950 [Microbacterium sp. NIBRBAC000506063]
MGLVLDGARLLTVSCWVPPAHTALRIRTWFFAAEAPEGEIVPQPDEVEEYQWLRPVDALERHGQGRLRLYPPTWVTLHGLSDQSDAAAALAEIRLAGIRRFETRFHPRRRRRCSGRRTGSTARSPPRRHVIASRSAHCRGCTRARRTAVAERAAPGRGSSYDEPRVVTSTRCARSARRSSRGRREPRPAGAAGARPQPPSR